MAKKTRKTSSCLIGCGVGCLLLLLAAIALFAGGAVWVRGLSSGFTEAVAAREALEEEFGEPSDFTPPPDGSIPPERLEAFLGIREATAEERARIRGFFDNLPLTEEEAQALEDQPALEQLRSVMGITSSALGLAGNIGDFFVARNEAFHEYRMGLGEYAYIYVLAYYSWLGKAPEDGPGDDDGRAEFGDAYRRVRRDLIDNLENQLAALPDGDEQAQAQAQAEPGAIRALLEGEIEALRRDRHRILYEDGLPPAIEAALTPFRRRLEDSYDPVTNPFELAQMEKRNRFSFEAN